MKNILWALLLLTSLVHAQTLVDAPKPQPKTEHKFLDKKNVVAWSISTGLVAWDAELTCKNLANGYHEVFAPVKSCPGIPLYLFGAQGFSFFGSFVFHKLHLHKLERSVPYIKSGATIYSLGYSYSSSQKLRPTPVIACGKLPNGSFVDCAVPSPLQP